MPPDFHITFNLQKQGALPFDSCHSKLMLQKLNVSNLTGNTGFLLWFSNHCFTCIFQYDLRRKSTKYYLTTFSDDGSLKMFQNSCDAAGSFIETITDTVKAEYK